jgi:Zn-dependent M28 family amino/carboxypeptidase
VNLPYFKYGRPRLAPLSSEALALAAALRRDVTILATDIGPRGTHAPDRYALARDFLIAALRATGYAPVSHDYRDFQGHTCTNLEVTIPGTTHPDEIVVVGAHYDSVPGCPAANDNGSGVAGLLAIARECAGLSFPRTLRLVFFANEEPPYFNVNDMGSQVYARACRARGDDIRSMLCFDTIGFYDSGEYTQSWQANKLGLVLPTTADFVALVGPASCRSVIRRAALAFARSKTFPLLAAAMPERIQEVLWSDHRGFIECGYPAFMITDTALLRYAHYHQATDTPEKLDYESMARVVKGTQAVVECLGGLI